MSKRKIYKVRWVYWFYITCKTVVFKNEYKDHFYVTSEPIYVYAIDRKEAAEKALKFPQKLVSAYRYDTTDYKGDVFNDWFKFKADPNRETSLSISEPDFDITFDDLKSNMSAFDFKAWLLDREEN